MRHDKENSIIPFNDNTKSNFVKIAFNTYAEKSDLSRVWSVESIDGKPYIVAIDSGSLVSNNYAVKELPDKIAFTQANTTIGEFTPKGKYTDISGLTAALSSEVIKHKFLPSYLFLEVLQRKASELEKYYINGAKLLQAEESNIDKSSRVAMAQFGYELSQIASILKSNYRKLSDKRQELITSWDVSPKDFKDMLKSEYNKTVAPKIKKLAKDLDSFQDKVIGYITKGGSSFSNFKQSSGYEQAIREFDEGLTIENFLPSYQEESINQIPAFSVDHIFTLAKDLVSKSASHTLDTIISGSGGSLTFVQQKPKTTKKPQFGGGETPEEQKAVEMAPILINAGEYSALTKLAMLNPAIIRPRFITNIKLFLAAQRITSGPIHAAALKSADDFLKNPLSFELPEDFEITDGNLTVGKHAMEALLKAAAQMTKDFIMEPLQQYAFNNPMLEVFNRDRKLAIQLLQNIALENTKLKELIIKSVGFYSVDRIVAAILIDPAIKSSITNIKQIQQLCQLVVDTLVEAKRAYLTQYGLNPKALNLSTTEQADFDAQAQRVKETFMPEEAKTNPEVAKKYDEFFTQLTRNEFGNRAILNTLQQSTKSITQSLAEFQTMPEGEEKVRAKQRIAIQELSNFTLVCKLYYQMDNHFKFANGGLNVDGIDQLLESFFSLLKSKNVIPPEEFESTKSRIESFLPTGTLSYQDTYLLTMLMSSKDYATLDKYLGNLEAIQPGKPAGRGTAPTAFRKAFRAFAGKLHEDYRAKFEKAMESDSALEKFFSKLMGEGGFLNQEGTKKLIQPIMQLDAIQAKVFHELVEKLDYRGKGKIFVRVPDKPPVPVADYKFTPAEAKLLAGDTVENFLSTASVLFEQTSQTQENKGDMLFNTLTPMFNPKTSVYPEMYKDMQVQNVLSAYFQAPITIGMSGHSAALATTQGSERLTPFFQEMGGGDFAARAIDTWQGVWLQNSTPTGHELTNRVIELTRDAMSNTDIYYRELLAALSKDPIFARNYKTLTKLPKQLISDPDIWENLNITLGDMRAHIDKVITPELMKDLIQAQQGVYLKTLNDYLLKLPKTKPTGADVGSKFYSGNVEEGSTRESIFTKELMSQAEAVSTRLADKMLQGSELQRIKGKIFELLKTDLLSAGKLSKLISVRHGGFYSKGTLFDELTSGISTKAPKSPAGKKQSYISQVGDRLRKLGITESPDLSYTDSVMYRAEIMEKHRATIEPLVDKLTEIFSGVSHTAIFDPKILVTAVKAPKDTSVSDAAVKAIVSLYTDTLQLNRKIFQVFNIVKLRHLNITAAFKDIFGAMGSIVPISDLSRLKYPGAVVPRHLESVLGKLVNSESTRKLDSATKENLAKISNINEMLPDALLQLKMMVGQNLAPMQVDKATTPGFTTLTSQVAQMLMAGKEKLADLQADKANLKAHAKDIADLTEIIDNTMAVENYIKSNWESLKTLPKEDLIPQINRDLPIEYPKSYHAEVLSALELTQAKSSTEAPPVVQPQFIPTFNRSLKSMTATVENFLRLDMDNWNDFMAYYNTISVIVGKFFNSFLNKFVSNTQLVKSDYKAEIVDRFTSKSYRNVLTTKNKSLAPNPISPYLLVDMYEELGALSKAGIPAKADAIAKRWASGKDSTNDKMYLVASLILHLQKNSNSITKIKLRRRDTRELINYLNQDTFTDEVLAKLKANKIDPSNPEKAIYTLTQTLAELAEEQNQITSSVSNVSKMEIATLFKEGMGIASLEDFDPIFNGALKLLKDAKLLTEDEGTTAILQDVTATLKSSMGYATTLTFASDLAGQIIATRFSGDQPDIISTRVQEAQTNVNMVMKNAIAAIKLDPVRHILQYGVPALIDISPYMADVAAPDFDAIYKGKTVGKAEITPDDLDAVDEALGQMLDKGTAAAAQGSYMNNIYHNFLNGQKDYLAVTIMTYLSDALVPYLLYITSDADPDDTSFISTPGYVDSRSPQITGIVSKLALLIADSIILSHTSKNAMDAIFSNKVNTQLPTVINGLKPKTNIFKLLKPKQELIQKILTDLFNFGYEKGMKVFNNTLIGKQFHDTIFAAKPAKKPAATANSGMDNTILLTAAITKDVEAYMDSVIAKMDLSQPDMINELQKTYNDAMIGIVNIFEDSAAETIQPMIDNLENLKALDPEVQTIKALTDEAKH